MKKRSFYQNLYKFEKTTNKYWIDVSLDDYNDIYDDWDPAPFKKRDIANEFNDFIVDSSDDIPLRFNIGITLFLPIDKKDIRKEASLIAAYENYYQYMMEKSRKTLSNLNKKILFNFSFSMFLLFIGYFYFEEDANIFSNVFKEGIFIGGWVFLWDFFTTIFFTRKEVKDEYKLYKRLYNADIRFVYVD